MNIFQGVSVWQLILFIREKEIEYEHRVAKKVRIDKKIIIEFNFF